MNASKQFSLVDQVAIVTGACGGLGQELVKILVDAEANVVLADVDQSSLNALALEINSNKVLAQLCDVTDKKAINNLIKKTHQKFGRIDSLVNCAGILGGDHFLFDVSEAEWDKVLDINLKGTWLMSTEVARYMIKHKIKGKIINISSSLGKRAQLKRIAYASSKAAVEHLTRNMAMELAEHDIRVNCLAPGWMETQMVREFLEGPEGEKWRKTIPLRRAAKPQELTGPLLLLASDASSYMTGTILRVDGGYTYCGIELPE
ncbi:acetyoacetyl CoA reductase [Legionella beliardensis]|uniref:Acetyoacetyl CoA reductase n=1 Tax=Legionella beliardensis TaxID=91822 RepID=A0A378I0U1_9GAMM|nr:SDR family oxidoreductase [Legionella beliardensis]STX28808.1 acetyoacetyl CoA reductase [Legionella beliardensis]